jgi:hypothetical protein
MKSRHALFLSILASSGLAMAATSASAAESYGPPTVSQNPPFPVPKSGYEVEGRTGLMHNIPNLEFVEWEPFNAPGFPEGVHRRLLSISPSMAAVAQVTHVPAGWTQPAGYDEVDNEIVVLEGDLTIGEGEDAEKLTKYSYSYIPAGMWRGPVTSRQGAVLLQWYKGAPKFVASKKGKRGARVHARVRDWNRYQTAWYIDDPFPAYRTGGNFPGYLHNLMRSDPDTGEQTWMTFVAGIPAPPSGEAGNFGGGAEVHPSFEEYYFPEGSEFATVDDRAPRKAVYGGECVEQGVSSYERGTRGYFWRAAGVAHGAVAERPAPQLDGDGNVQGGRGKANWSWTLVRTGTRLWATYVTDCTYQTGLEYLGEKGWRKYDYDVPRYVPRNHAPH